MIFTKPFEIFKSKSTCQYRSNHLVHFNEFSHSWHFVFRSTFFSNSYRRLCPFLRFWLLNKYLKYLTLKSQRLISANFKRLVFCLCLLFSLKSFQIYSDYEVLREKLLLNMEAKRLNVLRMRAENINEERISFLIIHLSSGINRVLRHIAPTYTYNILYFSVIVKQNVMLQENGKFQFFYWFLNFEVFNFYATAHSVFILFLYMMYMYCYLIKSGEENT